MGVTDDGRFVILSKSEATSGNALSVKDNKAPNGQFVVLMDSFEYEFNLIDNIGDDLFVLTNYKAPKYRLVKINFNQPGVENWKDVIPESENVVEFASLIGGKIVVSYMKNACSQVKVFNYDGTFDYDITLPGIGSIRGFSGKKEEPLAFYSFASFNTPGEIYQYNFATKENKLHFRPEVKFNPDDFEVSQVFYNSKDGTRIPMFIFSK
jgi:prolyl oligopeptidase